MRSTHTTEYYSAIKRNSVLILATNLTLSEKKKKARHKDHPLHDSIYMKGPEQANL